jgi:cysteine desulfurase
MAMEIPMDWAKGTVRLTTGRTTTGEDIDTAVKIITNAVNSMRK